jgi:ankyrin repeat protein
VGALAAAFRPPARTAATALVDAASRGDRQAVAALLQQRADVNERAADGSTALHWAAQNNDLPMVQQLIRAGADVKAASRYGLTPMTVAATAGSAAIAEALLNAGADPNGATPEGETILMTAARAGQVQIVRQLLARGANVNARENWQQQTALMWAAAENHGEVVKVLVEAGADMDLASKVLDGAPPRNRTAPDQGQQGVHTTFPTGGLTALHYAARQNAQNAVIALAETGVNLDQKDPDGFTAVILAILSGHYDMAALLIEKGAGVDTTDKSGRTPLFTAVDMNTFEYSYNRPTAKASGMMEPVDLVKFLLAKGANPNARLTDRIVAAKYGTAGNPNLTAGATPLMKAVSASDLELTRILLDAGADPFIRNSSQTNTLMVAAGLNWRRLGGRGPEPEAIEIIKLLLARGVALDSFNDQGQTPLHAAMMRGRGLNTGGDYEGPNSVPSINLIKFMVEQGARLDVKDKAGRTPVDVAEQMRNVEALEYIETIPGAPAPTITSSRTER